MKVVLATRNPGKLEELKLILGDIGIEVVSAKSAGFDQDVEEDRNTLEGNSLKKARVIGRYLGLPTVADDTGIFIKALNGKPGVYSARWAGKGADEDSLIQYTLNQLVNVPIGSRNAYFKTVVSLVLPTLDRSQIFTGIVHGTIATEARGDPRPGMPYDLLFIPKGLEMTFAEMSIEGKNKFSHRAKALMRLKEYLQNIIQHP